MDKMMLTALLKKLGMEGKLSGVGAKIGQGVEAGAHGLGSVAGKGASALGALMQKHPVKSGIGIGLGAGGMALGGGDEEESPLHSNEEGGDDDYEALLRKLEEMSK